MSREHSENLKAVLGFIAICGVACCIVGLWMIHPGCGLFGTGVVIVYAVVQA